MTEQEFWQKTRSLDPESAAILHRLTAGLADPMANIVGGRVVATGLIAVEIGPGRAPTVRAERLSADRYVVTRYVEIDTRTEDPEVNDRVAAPEVEFVHEGDNWFSVVARRGHYEGDEHDPNTLGVALLRLVALEQASELARGLDWPASPGARSARSRSLGDLWKSLWRLVACC